MYRACMSSIKTKSSWRNHGLARWLNAGSTEKRFFKVFFFQLIATMLIVTVLHYVLHPFGWKLFSKLPLTSSDEWVTCACYAFGSAFILPTGPDQKPKQTVE
jgi:hypothetical protein